MKTPHKHAELIKAWADGAEIEFYDTRFEEHKWKSCGSIPHWVPHVTFRIKPESKPDVTDYYCVQRPHLYLSNPNGSHNLKLTFDGETGKLKSAEVL